MKLQKIHIGMRTFKTGLAVFICIILFHVFHRDNPMLAVLSAAFSIREDFQKSVYFGKSRLLGNCIGGFLAILYFFINSFFKSHYLVNMILIPILVMASIQVSNILKNNAGIIAALAALLMICFNIPKDATLDYVLQRILDTMIGTVVGVGLNVCKQPKTNVDKNGG